MWTTHVKRKNDIKNELFNAFYLFHENIKLTIEMSPTKFLDSQILRNPDGSLPFNVVQKEEKLPLHWFRLCLSNLIKRDLHRANRIGSDFQLERSEIQKKYKHAGFLDKFIDSVFDHFGTPKKDSRIPHLLFKNQKKLPFKSPYCLNNELHIRKYIEKLNAFTNKVITFS